MKDSVVEVEVAGPRKGKVTRGRRGEGLRSTNPETNLATTLLNPGDVQDPDLHPQGSGQRPLAEAKNYNSELHHPVEGRGRSPRTKTTTRTKSSEKR